MDGRERVGIALTDQDRQGAPTTLRAKTYAESTCGCKKGRIDMSKKLLSVLLCLALLCAILPQNVFAAETDGKCGENLSWSFDRASGVLTVTGSGDMEDYQSEYTAPWSGLKYQITEIRLPDGLTRVGDFAFCGCANLREIAVPGSVTRIGTFAFADARSLSKLSLAEGLMTIGRMAFTDCAGLREVTLPNSVTELGEEVFARCDGLEQIMIPANVEQIGYAALSECRSLKEIRVAPENAAFCSEDGVLFSKDRTMLIQYPGGKTGAYRIPESVTMLDNSAFMVCAGLTEITFNENILNYADSSPAGILGECHALTRIQIPQSCEHFTSLDGVVFNKDRTELIQYPMGRAGAYEIPKGVTAVGMSAFNECDSLTAVTIPEGVTEIDTGAFFGCDSLKTVTFPESLTHIGDWSFMGCAALEEVSLPKNVMWIGEAAFSGCGSVKAYKVHPDNPHLCSEDGVLLLKDQSQLLHYPGARVGSYRIPDSVTVINYSAFAGCSGLETIELPASVEFLVNLELSGCTRLTAINIDPENPFLCSVDGVAFSKDMKELVRFPTGRTGEYRIPDGVKTIGSSAFLSCALTTLSIPDGVTRVGNIALAYNSNLKSVTFPASVDRIEDGMFMLDDHLERVTVLNPVCSIYYDRDTSPRSLGNPELTTYCGFRGSTAEELADRFGFRFELASRTGFADVGDAANCVDAVAWAVEQGIANGTTPYYFRSDAPCTRAQAVTFLWRARGCAEPERTDRPFADLRKDAYYDKAVAWAVENKITTGTGAAAFSPDSGCTRAQVVTFLWRAAGRPEPTSSANPFSDVKSDAYYHKAVLWAVEQGITKGTSADRFSPDAACTRGQIVTFLYRDMAE